VSLPVALWLPNVPILGPVIARLLLSHYVFGGMLMLVALAAWRWSVRPSLSDAQGEEPTTWRWNANAL